MQSSIKFFFCIVFLLLLTVSRAQDDHQARIAFVVGNSDYSEIDSLINPVNDATDVAQQLQNLGFTLFEDTVHLNLDERTLVRKFNRFVNLASGKDIAFFYYAGHGMQFNGEPYVLPVDVPVDDLDIVRRDAVSLNELLAKLDKKAELSIAVFDACREIPNYENQIRTITRGGNGVDWRGLSRPQVSSTSTLIAYSGGSGELVADGQGRNSPYTEILLEYLNADAILSNNLDVTDLFSEVAYVFRDRHRGQRPEIINQGVRPNQYYLVSQAEAIPGDFVELTQGTTSTELNNDLRTNSSEPSDEIEMYLIASEINTLAGYEDFLREFPEGRLASLVRRRVDQFRSPNVSLNALSDDKKTELDQSTKPEFFPIEKNIYRYITDTITGNAVLVKFKGVNFETGEPDTIDLQLTAGASKTILSRLADLGIELRVDNDRVVVDEPMPGSPVFGAVGNFFDFYADSPVILSHIEILDPAMARLILKVWPLDARVKVLNIASEYHTDMNLKLNQTYDLLVERTGYHPWRKYVTLDNARTLMHVVLKEINSGNSNELALNEPTMIEVAGGQFDMGVEWLDEDQRPVRKVNIADFEISKTEISVSQWREFVKNSGYSSEAELGDGCNVWSPAGGFKKSIDTNWAYPEFDQTGDHPVVCVSWNDAKAYVDWLSKETGKAYRLLSEAEWEYVAGWMLYDYSEYSMFSYDRSNHLITCPRARDNGCGSRNLVPSSELCLRESVADVSFSKYYGINSELKCNDEFVHTSPGASFLPNARGVFDLGGNVSEWVEDCYHENYEGAPVDGSARTEGGPCRLRVLRGASWLGLPGHTKKRYSGSGAYTHIGFRVAKSIEP